MVNEVSVYQQLTAGTGECLAALKREIGMKTNCMPFAVKLIEAMKTLSVRTEQEALSAANVLLSGLQTLSYGGIKPEDYDKIDFVKRGKTIVPSARVEAFYRAAARKGYRITDTIVAVPAEDANTTYFKENFYNGDVILTLEDRRFNADRAVNAQRLIGGYFAKFLCRLDVHDIKQNKRILMTHCEMSLEDMLAVSAASEQGIYKSRWEEYDTKYGKKKRKVITDEINTETFWVNWTGEMVNKTIIRRALKRVKEVLPELTESIYAFEQDEYEEAAATAEPEIAIPMQAERVDLHHLTSEQVADCQEMYQLFCANPHLAEDKTKEIKEMLDGGASAQDVIDREYASIVVLKKSPAKWAEIGAYFDETN